MSLEEVAVHPGYQVLIRVDNTRMLIVGDL
jgi:hypothetical protein